MARDEDREAIRAVVRDEVYPADAAFLEALQGEYLAATRTENGIWSAPNGEALYGTQILRWTTLELEPREVHQIGLDELETIEAERRAIARGAGFGDDTAALPRGARRRPGEPAGVARGPDRRGRSRTSSAPSTPRRRCSDASRARSAG